MVGAFVSLVWVGFLVVVSLCVNSVVNLRFFRCFIVGLVCVHVCGVCGGFLVAVCGVVFGGVMRMVCCLLVDLFACVCSCRVCLLFGGCFLVFLVFRAGC